MMEGGVDLICAVRSQLRRSMRLLVGCLFQFDKEEFD